MMKIPWLFSLILLVQSTSISITSPQTGDEIRGQLEIRGNMDIPGFSSAELAFSYASNPADSWFIIQTFPQPLANSVLATWDTLSLTDGDYILHLRVFLQDGSFQDVLVPDLKIRNDFVQPTETPTAAFSSQFIATPFIVEPEESPAAAITYPSSTPFALNPASVTNSSIYDNFVRGALLVLGLFILVGILLKLRSES